MLEVLTNDVRKYVKMSNKFVRFFVLLVYILLICIVLDAVYIGILHGFSKDITIVILTIGLCIYGIGNWAHNNLK